MARIHRSPLHLLVTLVAVGCSSANQPPRAPERAGAAAKLPEACEPDRPARQSPIALDSAAVEPATTCDPAGTDWRPCHQHLHCGPEHTGGGICAGADCEVHTVYRQRRGGGVAAAVADLHQGTVGGNCEPAQHDLMVRATFLDFDAGCEGGAASNLTYCGSATGNNRLDTNTDGKVSCAESGVNPTSVRWCVQTACECHTGSSPEAQLSTFGEKEATREQGCPGAAP